MAVPEGKSVYELHGTVLYCEVPVNTAIDEVSVNVQAQQWANADVPLDYDAALALREAEDAATASRYTATKARGSGAASREATTMADKMSLNTGGMNMAASATPFPPSRPGVPLPAANRPGGRGGGWGGSSAKGGQPRVHQESSLGDTAAHSTTRSGLPDHASLKEASATDAIMVQNARLVKVRLQAEAAGLTRKKLGGHLENVTARSSTETLTVAQAMEMLFPVEAAPRECLADCSGEEQEEGQSELNDATALSTTTTAAATASAAPVIWRRADVAHLSRLDVVLLYQHLQQRCASEAARSRGVVCPNRERIYNDGLREIVRQVTLLCPERGLLLDELTTSMRQAVETYDVLLDSASQYAVRKSTERDLHQHLFEEKARLETEVRRREHRVSEWRAKYAGLQKRFEDQQKADGELHAEEIAYAKRANQQLVNEIKRLASEAERAKDA